MHFMQPSCGGSPCVFLCRIYYSSLLGATFLTKKCTVFKNQGVGQAPTPCTNLVQGVGIITIFAEKIYGYVTEERPLQLALQS